MSLQLQDTNQGLNRREMVRGLIALFGTGVVAGCSGGGKAVKISDAFAQSFGEQERTFLTRVADIIIPQTDTPGAVDAGVVDMLEKVLTEWMPAAERANWLNGFRKINIKLSALAKRPFAQLDQDQQTDIMVQLDERAFAKDNKDDAAMVAYHGLKEEIGTAYYLSEKGATEELRYELVPGEWKSCIPFSEVGRTWAQ